MRCMQIFTSMRSHGWVSGRSILFPQQALVRMQIGTGFSAQRRSTIIECFASLRSRLASDVRTIVTVCAVAHCVHRRLPADGLLETHLLA